MSKKLNVAIVGLEFGKEFIPIYQHYPYTNMYAICQRSREKLDKTGDDFGVDVRYDDYAEMLRDPEIDVVHINTPLQIHADQVVAALEAGKHVGCTIPMATSVADCKRIVDAAEKSGLVYMMMETVVYSREFLFVKELYEKGELGDIQFIRASHQQEMWGWPDYWHGMPPMHNATHAISPCLSVGMWEAESVSCLGAGRVQEFMVPKYGCPFAIETTHIRFKGSDVGAEVTRSLFNTARQYREHFDIFGSKKTFEWTQLEGEDHVIHTGEEPARVKIPDYAHRLPKEIQAFTTGGVYDTGDNAHRSFIQGGGHGGSHPHLVHELVSAIREGRDPYPNARQAANITCAGILSHESAMQGGKNIPLPEWTLWKNKPMLSKPASWAKKLAASAAALMVAFVCGTAPVQAEANLSVSGYAWTQYLNGLTHQYKGAANFDYQPFVGGGGLLFLESKPSESWTANLSMGVAFRNSATKKLIPGDSGAPAKSKIDPKSLSMDMGSFLHEAGLSYQLETFGIKVGKFHYTYSDYNHNMGLYLLRGPVYPGFLYSGFEEIGGLTKTGLLSSWSPIQAVRWDVIASFETDFKPYMDINLSSFLTVKAGFLELGAGVEAQRLVEFNSCATSPQGWEDVNDCLGGNPGNGYVGDPSADPYKGAYFVIDTTVPGVADTTLYSLAGTKLMMRGALDFKKVLSSYSGGPKDFVLYFEAALLGVKDYPHLYDKKSRRTPVLMGVNLPAYGLLDLLSLEVEYYAAPYQNDPYKLTGAYDLFSFGDGNNLNYALSPIPPSKSLFGPGSNQAKTQVPYDTNKDNWKWSLLLTKRVQQKITFKLQLASDHWRTPNNNLVFYEAMANPGQFYGAMRVDYSL